MRTDLFTDEIKKVVFAQSYDRKPMIDGLRITEVRYFTDDGGFFLEIARLDEHGLFVEGDTLPVRQVNYSEIQPGVVKAWHLHPEQNEIWFIPPTERLLLGFFDARKDSATKKNSQRFAAGAGKAHLIYIPHGVAHGLVNLSDHPMHMLYFVSHQFTSDPLHSQEFRLPWDYLGKTFWEIENG